MGLETFETLAGSRRGGKDADLPTGTAAGSYVIDKKIGSGAYGAVYAARHRLLPRRAAIKVLHHAHRDQTELFLRFIREAESVNRIRHPNIVDIFDLNNLDDGRPYLAMEFVDGGTLDERLRGQKRCSPAELLDLLPPLCGALQAAHDANFIHRDLKLSNIGLMAEGGLAAVKLLDFGVAKLVDPGADSAMPALSRIGQQIGSPVTMSPEQIRGVGVDHRADIYALGVLIFRILTGSYPFEAAPDSVPGVQDIQRFHLAVAAPPPSTRAPIPAALDSVVLRCLKKDPDERYSNANDVLAAVRDALDSAPPSVAPAVARPTSRAAVALLFEIVLPPTDSDDEMDDELLDDLDNILNLVETAIEGAGFALLVQTSEVIVAAKLLPESPDEERLRRLDALNLASDLHAKLVTRDGATPHAQIRVCVNAGPADVEYGATGLPRIAGGRIADASSWSATPIPTGLVVATPEAARNIDHDQVTVLSETVTPE